MAQCASDSTISIDENSNFQIVYTVDNDGLFLYDLKTETKKKLYETDQIFLEKEFKFINDSILIVGHRSKSLHEEKERRVYSKYVYHADGDSTFITDSPSYITIDKRVYVIESFYAINLNDSSNYKHKTIEYEHIDGTTLKIKATSFDNTGKVANQTDTTFLCGMSSSSYKGIEFCNSERFFSRSETVNNKQVFSRGGDLYLTDLRDTLLLLKFDGHFEPKFGSGYYNPTLSADGKKISFQYLAGFLGKGSAIFEMDIETKEKKELVSDRFYKPKYSPSGKRLLVAKDNRQDKNSIWINDIHVFDISTSTATKITEGNDYLWRPGQ